MTAPPDITERIVALRRDLHRFPELSCEEHRTMGRIADELRALGITPRVGVAGTGVVAELGGGVVAAAGLVLVILGVTSGSPSSSPSAATLVPDVRVGPNGASFGLAGRF